MKRERLTVARALESEKLRFGLVGIINTAVDFGVLFLLARFIGVPAIPANMISTGCAVLVSYLLNKRAVFKNVDRQGTRQIVLFVVVTLAGLWVIQSIIIAIITSLLSDVGNTELQLLVAKVIATIASLVWNYLWYSRVIFRKK